MRGEHIVPYLLSRPEEQCNSMWLSFDVCVCVRVCLRFVVPSVVPSLWLFWRAVAWEKEVSFDFDNRKLVSVWVIGIGKE